MVISNGSEDSKLSSSLMMSRLPKIGSVLEAKLFPPNSYFTLTASGAINYIYIYIWMIH